MIKLGMDSGRKMKALNVTELKTNVTKRCTPNMTRRQLNETARPEFLTGTDCNIKNTASHTLSYDTECDIAYNDYLKVLLRKQFVKKKVAEFKSILDDQILIHREKLYQRNETYKAMVNDTETFQKRSELVEVIDFLQENLNKLTNVYYNDDMRAQLKHTEQILNSKCDKVILKNIKSLGNQQDYDKFIDTLQLSLVAMEKIINSGRDFEGIHHLADNIRKFLQLKCDVNKSQGLISKLEKDAMYTLLQNMSDLFAVKYSSDLLT